MELITKEEYTTENEVVYTKVIATKDGKNIITGEEVEKHCDTFVTTINRNDKGFIPNRVDNITNNIIQLETIQDTSTKQITTKPPNRKFN